MTDAGRDRRRYAGHPGPLWRARRMAAVGCLLVVAAAGMAGCAARAGATQAVELTSAFVPVSSTPGTTVAYVVIRNNGPADRLIAARTSAGGRVQFRATHGSAEGPAVSSVPVPADDTLRMAPDGVHMVLTGIGPLHGGKAITLTLVFARAGALSVVAQVTNPESGGSSYFLN
jgi:copper(I)-binding protein